MGVDNVASESGPDLLASCRPYPHGLKTEEQHGRS